MKLDCLLLLFFLAAFPSAIRGGVPQANLLTDGDFETGSQGVWEKRTPDDRDRTLSLVGEATHSGKLGARIVNQAEVISRWRQGADGKIQAPPGSAVRLQGWLRTDLGESGSAALRLYCMGPKGAILAQPQTLSVRGKSPWRRVARNVIVPEGCDHLMVYLELEKAIGTADYDDIALSIIQTGTPRPPTNDLLLLTDAPPSDPVVTSLRTLYPDRLVVSPPSDSPSWSQFRGAVAFARSAETRFDLPALEAFAQSGHPVVMDLELYSASRGAKLRTITAAHPTSLRIHREIAFTRGFQTGDSIPWGENSGGHWSQRVLDGVSREKVIAESSEGGALVVAEPLGKGVWLATDLTGIREPIYNQPGSFNKYLFAGNALGGSVHFGRHFPRRLPYAELLEAMSALVAELPALRLLEEGPASGEYRIHSLNLGEPSNPTFFLYGATHGSEWESAYGLLTLARLLATQPPGKWLDTDRYAVKIIPILNPSGYDLNTRQNAARVDLNRNGSECWEAFRGRDSNQDGAWGPGDYDWKGANPFSEPETQTFRAICERTPLHAVLDFHGNPGGPGNNQLVVLPLTGRTDNEDRAAEAVQEFNEAMRNRYILQQANRPAIAQYNVETTNWDSPRPTLIETACKGRYGFLTEVPAGYGGTYGIVMQTDLVVETCLTFFKAYQLP